jgi:uncharacterized protein (TIGR02246 family)
MVTASHDLATTECTRLVQRFCVLADRGEAKALAELFTADGSFQRGDLHVQGRTGIESMTAGRPAGMATRHLLTTSLVEVAGDDAASGTHYCLVYVSGAGQDPKAPIVREYQDCYRRTEEGWLIESRTVLTPFPG